MEIRALAPLIGLASMFLICSLVGMHRLDAETLAIHLEVALATAPQRTLDEFRGSGRYHSRTTADLARYLADRLAGLEFTVGKNWVDPEAQRSLFNGKC